MSNTRRSAGRAAASAAAGRLASAAHERVDHVVSRVGAAADAVVDTARDAAVAFAEARLNAALDRVATVAKRSIVDPDMPRPVAATVEAAFDELFPEVRYEVLASFYSMVRTPVDVPDGTPPPWCSNPVRALRARVLYSLYPHNRSFWRQIRSPLYWLLRLISLVPVYGVSQIFFLVILALRDMRDEWALCSYILEIKSAFLITDGVIPAISGAAQYFVCLYRDRSDVDVAAMGASARTTGRSCLADGPGQGPLYLSLFVLLQVVLVFVACCALPFSKKKGGRRYHARGRAAAGYDSNADGVLDENEADEMVRARAAALGGDASDTDDDAKTAARAAARASGRSPDLAPPRYCCGVRRYLGRGGLLRWFVAFDMVAFTLAAAGVAWVATRGDRALTRVEWTHNPHFRAAVFWLHCAYALASAPFLVFQMPMATRFLTHARPTAYNRAGATVPIMPPVSRAAERAAVAPEPDSA